MTSVLPLVPCLPPILPACTHWLSDLKAGPGLPSPANYPLWKEALGSPGPLTPLGHAGTCTLGSILCPGTFPGCFYLCLELATPTSADPSAPPLKWAPTMLSGADPVLSRKVLGPPTEYWGIGVRRLPTVRGGQTSSKQVKQV